MVISEYKCNKCGFTLPEGWGGYVYVTDDNGNRIVCRHPSERHYVVQVLGENASHELIRERTGFNSHCLCLDCLYQFEIDLKKDEKVCPKCNSTRIKAELDLVDQLCPRCKEGIIEEKTIAVS